MPRLSSALFVLALAFPVACSSDGPKKVDPVKQLDLHRELALRFYDLDDLNRAEDQAVKGLELEPQDVQLRLLLGWICQRRGSSKDVFAAEKIFRELESAGDYRAMLGLGVSLERKGMLYDEAADGVGSGARVTNADDPKARVVELRKLAQDAWTEAEQCYRKVLEKKDGEAQAINGLSRVASLQRRWEDSLQWNRKLLAQCESELKVWTLQLARPDLSAQEERRLRDLRAGTEKLVLAASQDAAALFQKLERREEALAALDQALIYAPDLPEVHSRRGQLLVELGRYDEAIPSLEKFLKLSPLEFEHKDVQRAYELLAVCKRGAAAATPTKP
ncbi:MAG: tetratricopeptide repeat protein [Planctomycetes bacterium]|nr:tetratricopeptide repeat protein [Planctomycetota bacterium]